MTKEPISIEVKDLRKSYKHHEVLKGVSFTIQKDTMIFALLGSNGAGKTTAINILTTLTKADAGEATIGTFDVASQPAKVREIISLTGQFAAVDEALSARQNLVLIGELRHIKDPAQTANQLLEQFELVEAADRLASTFSGGMRRRLDIAMSLIGDPAVIFLDEPTTGLDPQSRNKMWALIKELAKSGTTIFLTTQYLEEADQLADRIAVLNEGRIVAEGTPAELKNLLPHGQITLRFADTTQLDKAAALFKQHGPVRDDTGISLTLNTKGSVTELARIFNKLEHDNIKVAEFIQKSPTLDDAFFKIINSKEEN